MEAILDSIFSVLKTAEAQAAVLAIVADFLFRIIPSKKPLGVIHLIIGVAAKIGALLIKVQEVSDKVLPQNVKENPLVVANEKKK